MKTTTCEATPSPGPAPGMRKAMAEAEVGDDVYGEDPTVNKLQEMAAELTGKEAALFVSSGSMGNLIPIYLNCGKGNELLIESRGHSVQHELAGVTAIAGSLPIMISAPKGLLAPDLLEPWIQPDIYYCAHTRMIAAGEHAQRRRAGPSIPSTPEGDRRLCPPQRKLSVHIDGARLFNAVAASGMPARTLCAETDTVTFCLSKGLGAPWAPCSAARATSSPRRGACARCWAAACGRRASSRRRAVRAHAQRAAARRGPRERKDDRPRARGTTWAQLDPDDVVTNIIVQFGDMTPETATRLTELAGIVQGPRAAIAAAFANAVIRADSDTLWSVSGDCIRWVTSSPPPTPPRTPTKASRSRDDAVPR